MLYFYILSGIQALKIGLLKEACCNPEKTVLDLLSLFSFFQVSAADMNIITPRLDLTDNVSIIFSSSFLSARTEAAVPDKGRVVRREEEASPPGWRH